MTVAEMLLPKLNDWEPAGPDRQYWSSPIADLGWSLHLAANRVDTLGCLLWEATLTRTTDAADSNAALKKRAERVAERATGLMEPLYFIELDEVRGVALLRSETPAQRGAVLSYYEMLMTSREIVLRRFQIDPEKRGRVQTAFALTHEAIAKLVDDLVRE
jgi:hypothetical protein